MKFGIFYEHQLPRPWEESPDPTIAAISAGLILLTIMVLLAADRLAGLRRLADF